MLDFVKTMTRDQVAEIESRSHVSYKQGDSVSSEPHSPAVENLMRPNHITNQWSHHQIRE